MLGEYCALRKRNKSWGWGLSGKRKLGRACKEPWNIYNYIGDSF